jgi:hypothetical protein
MSTRGTIIVLVGVVLAGALAALWMHDDVKPIKRLSRGDVLEIRSVATRTVAPGWSWFTRANLPSWLTFVRMWFTFRIYDIRQTSILLTLRPDATAEETGFYVKVRYREYGLPTGAECRLEKKNGRWIWAPEFVPFPTLCR